MALLILKIFISILVPTVVWLVLKRFASLLSYFKIRKANALAKSLVYSNLTSNYTFIDHAIDDYEEELSQITISSKDNIMLDSYLTPEIENLLSIDKLALQNTLHDIASSIKKAHPQIELEKPCYFVSFIMHNRDQRKQNDEAHWFKIECVASKMQYRLISQELFSLIEMSAKLNQPEKLNSIFPLIYKISFFCNLVIESDIEDRTILCKYDNTSNKYKPLLDIPFEYFVNHDLKCKCISLSEIKEFIAKFYMSKSIEINESRITDIGIEFGEIVLFVEAITYSKLDVTDNNMHFINKRDFIQLPLNMFSKRMYNSILRTFLK